jgi:hypothetical protein
MALASEPSRRIKHVLPRIRRLLRRARVVGVLEALVVVIRAVGRKKRMRREMILIIRGKSGPMLASPW